jgi:hypothetical protein
VPGSLAVVNTEIEDDGTLRVPQGGSLVQHGQSGPPLNGGRAPGDLRRAQGRSGELLH